MKLTPAPDDHDTLNPIADGIWVTSIPHRFIGLRIGTRMTVVRLPSGALLLHSPVPITAALRQAIDAIGPVGHIVCPNLFHHMYAGDAQRAYPSAVLHGPASLQRKRRDLQFGATLGDSPHPDWGGALQTITIGGSLLDETVLYHAATRTLITSDLVENFHDHAHAPTRWYLRVGGLLGKVGWHPLLRIVYVNRRKARACVERILAWPFERVVVDHGEVITDDARKAVRQGLNWLL